MKKNVLLFMLGIFLMLLPCISSAENIDMTDSTISITGPTTIQIRNMAVEGYSGTYWAEFIWDPGTLSFKLVEADVDAAAPTPGWNIEYNFSFTSALKMHLSKNAANSSFTLAVAALKGVPYFYLNKVTIKQNDNIFNLESSAQKVGENTALFTPAGGWSGNGQIDPGVTKTGTIGMLPSWFDMSAPFTFIYSTSPYNLQ